MWESLILERLQDWQALGYVLVFIGMVVEGEAVLFAAIFLSYAGYLSLPYVLVTSFLGLVIGDSLWYWLGHLLERFLFAKKLLNGLMSTIDRQLHERTLVSLVIAKFIYFLHRVVLVRARMCGIPFKKFFRADLVAILLWITVSTSLAIVFAESFSLLKQYFKYTEIGLLALILIFIGGEHVVSSLYKKRLIKKVDHKSI